jgi:short-subunit dehydrogenase
MERNMSVLITGASTGIGKECAFSLAKCGYKVFAGVRNPADFNNLKNTGDGNIQPIILDVRKDEDVKSVYQIISEEKDYPLFGLVNNAGVGIGSLIETTIVEDLITLFDVNLFGVHRITKIMLPLIRKSKGRIINIGSSSSYMAGPALGPYAASKFALRAYNDALRIEMKTLDVSVSFVAPGPIETPIWEKARVYKEKLRRNTDPELLKVYDVFVKAGDELKHEINPIPALHVANAVVHSITARKPKYVYLIGRNAKMANIFSRMPKKWIDNLFLNRIRKLAIKAR